MASTYVNNLRLQEMTTGEKSGTWGTITNTNLELIGEALASGTENLGSDADATITMADGVADGIRSLHVKITSGVSLSATRTITLAPNTIKKVWLIENATTGSQSITISQGSGANVTIANGTSKFLFTDGAGSGAAVTELPVLTDAGGTIDGSLTLGASASILADALLIASATGAEEYITAAVNGAVNLFHNDVSKFSTTADGVDVTATGSIKIATGTTGERPASPATGDFRFNTTTTAAEIYNGSDFVAVGGGATGGGSDEVFVENGQTVTTNYTISTNKNAMSTGPITINSGISVTVPSGSNYVVL